MIASQSQYQYLLLIKLLVSQVVTNSAATCVTPISAKFSRYPECARSCMGCTDSNESFAHACEIDSGACCQGETARIYIPLVYGCTSSVCPSAEAEKSWEQFLDSCRRMGFPVDERDTPAGYQYSSDNVDSGNTRGTTTQTGKTTPVGSGGHITDTASTPTSSASTVTPPPTEQSASDGGSKSGLGTGEIVGISLGAVSALGAIIGVWLRWKHLELAKKNAAATEDMDESKLKPLSKFSLRRSSKGRESTEP